MKRNRFNSGGDTKNNNNSTRGGTPAQQKVKFANTIIPGVPKGVTNESNFNAAFKKARKKLGPNKEFMYKLKGDRAFKSYSTDYKEEK